MKLNTEPLLLAKKEQKLTYFAIQAKTGISQPELHRILNNKLVQLNLNKLSKVCKALNVSEELLIQFEKESPNE